MNKELCDLKDSEFYILSYEVKNNAIIVHLANQTDYEIPYTKRNEEVIISRMETQASTLKKKKYSNFEIILYMIQIGLSAIALTLFLTGMTLYSGLVFGYIVIRAVEMTVKFLNKRKTNAEVEKIQYFLDNKEGLNYIAENNEKAKELLNEKTIEIIDSEIKSERKPFNINNIDNYKLSELKKLRRFVKEYYSNEETYTLEQPVLLEKRIK